jgi:hypothetical protein
MSKKTKGPSAERYRSAQTGKFVSKSYASKHPKTTVRETFRTKSGDSGTIGGGARRKGK